MRTLLSAQRGTEEAAELRDQNIPLPFASLGEAGLEEYDGTRDNAGQIRGMYVDQELRNGVNVDWPTPVNLPYQLDFWCETRRQLRHFIDTIRRLFKLQVTYVDVDFQSPVWSRSGFELPPEVLMLGKRQVALKVSTWTDASNLETEGERRKVRASVAMSLSAWMARGYTEVPLVREVRVEVSSPQEDEPLLSVVAEPPEIRENDG